MADEPSPQSTQTPIIPIHVIQFSGSIYQPQADRIRQVCCQAMGQQAKEIWLHLDTDGGSSDSAFGLYGFLRSLPIPLTIHSLGNIQSMGVVIFLAGSKRLACPHSRFLIHPMHWNFVVAGKVDHSRLREHLGSLDNDLERYVQIFEERTQGAKKSLKIKPHLSAQEKIISADDALTFGIVEHIEQATIPQTAACYFVT